jgi:hypothetical protein
MSYRWLSAVAFTALLTFFGQSVFAAEPTLQQVYQAAETGDFVKAQGMMDQVLRDHPNSAKAHYVEAEILAKQGKNTAAKAELETAERLQPGLSFAKSGALQELKSRLYPSPVGTTEMISERTPGAAQSFPWGLLMMGLGLFAPIVYFMRRRPAPVTVHASGGFGPAPQPYGYGGAGPLAPQGGGTGSGLLGSLATGAAVGVGMVAAESLMHRVLDGGHPSSEGYIPGQGSVNEAPSSYDMGGNDFGVSDSSSWDDSSSGGGGDWN